MRGKDNNAKGMTMIKDGYYICDYNPNKTAFVIDGKSFQLAAARSYLICVSGFSADESLSYVRQMVAAAERLLVWPIELG